MERGTGRTVRVVMLPQGYDGFPQEPIRDRLASWGALAGDGDRGAVGADLVAGGIEAHPDDGVRAEAASLVEESADRSFADGARRSVATGLLGAEGDAGDDG